jgi:hypothetical protein
MLDRRELLKEPAVRAAKAFSQEHMRAMANSSDEKAKAACLLDRLNLLLMEPLFALPPLPANFVPTEGELPVALQIAFLQGDRDLHAQWLEDVRHVDDKQGIMAQLYAIGDYTGAMQVADLILAEQPDNQDALQVKQRILANQSAMKEQLASLAMLPRHISDDYWEKAATDVLRLGSADWKAHALIGDALAKRKHPSLALLHERLAAQYAPTPKDKQYWTRRANKIERSLARSK